MKEETRPTRGGIPRGLGRDGANLLSYGFRLSISARLILAISTITICDLHD